MAQVTGTLFNIQRFSLHDGPGIRTTVFMKGCNLSCAWCHNPESFSPDPQLSVNTVTCTSCGACEKTCPNGAHRINPETGEHTFDESKCTLCGACQKACPAAAITVIGTTYTVEEVMKTVLRDKMYYGKSGGGVTFSGGEATMQFDFLLEMLKACKAEGLHTCVETNGMLNEARLTALCEYVDLFLFDYKLYDSALHEKYTGAPNEPILRSLDLLAKLNKPVIVRCPIIPGVNDTDEHFAAIRAVREKYPNIEDAEIMPYHDIGAVKWKNIGKSYLMRDVKVPTKDQTAEWRKAILL